MNQIPMALIIDDPAPRVFVYREHADSDVVADGRKIPDAVPNAFLERFCDVVEKHGIKGKYSVVPMPGGRGRVDEHLEGFPDCEVQEWLTTVKTRLAPYFSFCPELLTHKGYIDLATMQMQEEWENSWSFRQSAETLTQYIALALQILKNAGIDATGVTSPWNFGVENEAAYAEGVAKAMRQVSGRNESWYFCRSLYGTPNARPWIAYREENLVSVAIPGTVRDHIWQSMDTAECSDAYVSAIADTYLTADGKSGEILDVLASGGWPILTTHWQSLFSNGLETGLRILDTVAYRVEEHLYARVQWMRHEEIMRETLQAEQ